MLNPRLNEREKMKLKDKICIVTGGARGIGREISRCFLEEGALVVIFDTNEEEAQKTAKDFAAKSYKDKFFFYKADVTNEHDIEEKMSDIYLKFTKIDILVNNAGITKDNLVLRMEVGDFKKVLDVNLIGTFICAKVASRYMVKQKHGKIINMSSVIGLHGNVGQSNYSASKAGVIGFTKSLAKELASRSINVNAVAPGFIDTEMTKKLDEKYKEKIIQQIPMGKFGTPEDVAKVVLFLASNDSDYLTGEVIRIDGGMAI